MITLEQARKVKHGQYLTQEDVDLINKYEGGIKLAANWAIQYNYDRIAEDKAYRQFERDTYGS